MPKIAEQLMYSLEINILSTDLMEYAFIVERKVILTVTIKIALSYKTMVYMNNFHKIKCRKKLVMNPLILL